MFVYCFFVLLFSFFFFLRGSSLCIFVFCSRNMLTSVSQGVPSTGVLHGLRSSFRQNLGGKPGPLVVRVFFSFRQGSTSHPPKQKTEGCLQ